MASLDIKLNILRHVFNMNLDLCCGKYKTHFREDMPDFIRDYFFNISVVRISRITTRGINK